MWEEEIRIRKKEKKEYELENNSNFLHFFKNQIKAGCEPNLDINGLQALIDKIVNWYEIKLPEREINPRFDTEHYYFMNDNIDSISKKMSIEQLFLRMSSRELYFLECLYGGDSWSRRHEKVNEQIGEGYTTIIDVKVNESENLPIAFRINIDSYTGKVLIDQELVNIVENGDYNIEQLLIYLEQRYNKYDLTGIRKSIVEHEASMELRKRLLELVALKLFYVKNEQLETGYLRAKAFIEEFNQKIYKLYLSSERIDEIIQFNKQKIK